MKEGITSPWVCQKAPDRKHTFYSHDNKKCVSCGTELCDKLCADGWRCNGPSGHIGSCMNSYAQLKTKSKPILGRGLTL